MPAKCNNCTYAGTDQICEAWGYPINVERWVRNLDCSEHTKGRCKSCGGQTDEENYCENCAVTSIF